MHYYDDDITIYQLVRDVFTGIALVGLVVAISRVARSLLLAGQVDAYDELADAYTPEEREQLIHRIKVGSLRR